MSRHLTSQEVTDWRSGVTGAEEILRLDDHLTECVECRTLVSGDMGSDIRALQAEFSAGHLTEAQLDDYAEHRPLAADSMQHLDGCPECRADADDLRRFADAKGANAERAPSRKDVGNEPVFLRRAAPVWLRPMAAALAVTAVALAAWLAVSRHRSGGAQQNGAQQAPLEVASNIPPRYQSEVNAAIDSGTLHIPGAISGLAGGPIQLRSVEKPAAAEVFHVVSPVATGVIDDRPLFQWTPVEGATYRVSVYDDQFRAVASAVALKTAEWRPETALARGALYRWEVRAVKGTHVYRAPAPTDPEARFAVLSADDARRLTEAGAAMPNAPLALGILYANGGALDDAKRELSLAAARGNPAEKSAAARLLSQFTQAR